jgi:hypothetical protein
MLSLEDKNKFTMVVSFSVAWDLLPLQIMFIGTTSKTLPSITKERQIASKMVGTSP